MYKLLNSSKEPIKVIELSSKTIKENDKLINDINTLDSLIDQNLDKKNENHKDSDINKDIDIIDEDKTSSQVLKKLSFFDFFFNNIYYKKFCIRIKKQYLIDSTNDILYKYLSADSLLYNQIKLENLFKDYKWNNSLLNDVENNKLIINLKSI